MVFLHIQYPSMSVAPKNQDANQWEEIWHAIISREEAEPFEATALLESGGGYAPAAFPQ